MTALLTGEHFNPPHRDPEIIYMSQILKQRLQEVSRLLMTETLNVAILTDEVEKLRDQISACQCQSEVLSRTDANVAR